MIKITKFLDFVWKSKIQRNMKVTVIIILVGILGKHFESLEEMLEELVIIGRIEIL